MDKKVSKKFKFILKSKKVCKKFLFSNSLKERFIQANPLINVNSKKQSPLINRQILYPRIKALKKVRGGGGGGLFCLVHSTFILIINGPWNRHCEFCDKTLYRECR